MADVAVADEKLKNNNQCLFIVTSNKPYFIASMKALNVLQMSTENRSFALGFYSLKTLEMHGLSI